VIHVEQIESQLARHALVRSVDQLRNGPVRIETAFLYPDGASIDLFLVEDDDLFRALHLSDLGQTMAWLLDVQVKPWLSRKRQAFVDDALRLHGVQQKGGQLVRALPEADDLMPAIVALGQACVRVADLMFTKRSSMVAAFAEQVEEVLVDLEVPYVPNAELEGRFGRAVRVDFLAVGRSAKSAILTLSSGNTSQAHLAANEIFQRWFSLDIPQRSEQRITILDDRTDVYRSDDIQRLRALSQLVAFSDRQTLGDLLAA
jgi:Domain of unknown function DUF1828